ncbi:hypothetical protein C8R46DRAFT_1044845 [Mycena filopes]|nr:hypothetical protein C8R46DRAFT_1044845 [Mycena filopes]
MPNDENQLWIVWLSACRADGRAVTGVVLSRVTCPQWSRYTFATGFFPSRNAADCSDTNQALDDRKARFRSHSRIYRERHESTDRSPHGFSILRYYLDFEWTGIVRESHRRLEFGVENILRASPQKGWFAREGNKKDNIIGGDEPFLQRDDLNPRRISKQVDLASLQRSPRAPQVLGDDECLQGLSSAGDQMVPAPSALRHCMITYLSTGASPYCSSDPLYPTLRRSPLVDPRLHAYGPRPKCSASLHDHISFDRSVSLLQLGPPVSDAQTVPTGRSPTPRLRSQTGLHQRLASLARSPRSKCSASLHYHRGLPGGPGGSRWGGPNATTDESVRTGQCDEDDLRSHRSELAGRGDECEEAGLHQQIVTTRLKGEPALATLFSHRDPRPPPPGYGPPIAPAVHEASHSRTEGRTSFAPDLTKERPVSTDWSMQEERNAYGSRCLDTRGAPQSRPREHRHSIGGFAGRPRHMASPSRSHRPLRVLPLLLPSTAMQRAEANPLVCGRPLTTSTGDIGGSSVPGSRNSKMGSPSLDRDERAPRLQRSPRAVEWRRGVSGRTVVVQSAWDEDCRQARGSELQSLRSDDAEDSVSRRRRTRRKRTYCDNAVTQSTWTGDCGQGKLIAGEGQFETVGVESGIDQWGPSGRRIQGGKALGPGTVSKESQLLVSQFETVAWSRGSASGDRLGVAYRGPSCSRGTIHAEDSVSHRRRTRSKRTYCNHAVVQSAWAGNCEQGKSVAGNDRAKVVQSAHQIDLLRDPPRIKVVALQERFCALQREQEGPHKSSSSTSNAGRKRLDNIFRILSGQARTLLVPRDTGRGRSPDPGRVSPALNVERTSTQGQGGRGEGEGRMMVLHNPESAFPGTTISANYIILFISLPGEPSFLRRRSQDILDPKFKPSVRSANNLCRLEV